MFEISLFLFIFLKIKCFYEFLIQLKDNGKVFYSIIEQNVSSDVKSQVVFHIGASYLLYLGLYLKTWKKIK